MAALVAPGPVLAQAPPNSPPPGAYQAIPNFTGTGAGALFRKAINDRFSGVQPIAPDMIQLSFANLPPESDGSLIYCSNCTRTAVCAAGGPGAFAFGQQGQWNCAPGGGGTITAVSAGANLVGGGSSGAVSVGLVPLPLLADASPVPSVGNSATGLGGSPISINKPTGNASGHVEVASIFFQSETSITPPSGWALIRSDAISSGNVLNEYCHTAGGSEPSSYSWTYSGGFAWGAIVDVIGATGCPADVSSGVGGTSNSVTIPAAAASAAPELVLAFGAQGSGSDTVSFSKGASLGISPGESFGAASFAVSSTAVPAVAASSANGSVDGLAAALVALKGGGTLTSAPVLQGDDYAQLHRIAATVSDGSSTISGYVVNRKYDVRAYGALGDCKTDDTAAIQNAINAACSAGFAGGILGGGAHVSPMVYFPQGCYRHNGVLIDSCGQALTFKGDGPMVSTLVSALATPGLLIEPSQYVSTLGTVTAAPLATGSNFALNFDNNNAHSHFYNLKDAGFTSAPNPLDGRSALSIEFFGNFAGSSGRNGDTFWLMSSYGKDTFNSGSAAGCTASFSGGMCIAAVQGASTSTFEGCLNLSTSGEVCASGSAALTNGANFEAELSYDGSTVRLFVNGAQVGSAAGSGTVVQAASESWMLGDVSLNGMPFAQQGVGCCSGQDHWVGQLLPLRISNVARHTAAYTAPSAAFSNDGNTLLVMNGISSNDAFVSDEGCGNGGCYNLGGWMPAYNYGTAIASGGSSNPELDDLDFDGGTYGLLSFGVLNGRVSNIAFGNHGAGSTVAGLKFWDTNYGWSAHDLTFTSGNGEANIELLFASGLQNFVNTNLEGAAYAVVLGDATATFTHVYNQVASNQLASFVGDAGISNIAGGLTLIDGNLDVENAGLNIPFKFTGGGRWTIINSAIESNAGVCTLPILDLHPSNMLGVALINTGVDTICGTAPELVKVTGDVGSGVFDTPVVWTNCTVNNTACDQSAIPLSNIMADVTLIGGKGNRLQGLTLGGGALLSSVTDSVANTTPAVSGCGTGPSVAAGGTSNAFVVTVGSGTVTSCAVSFGSAANFKNAPVCTATDTSTFQAIKVTAPSASGITLAAQTNMGGDQINVNCIGK